MAKETTDFTHYCDGYTEPEKPLLQMPPEERRRRSMPNNPPATDWAHAVPILRSSEKMLLLVLARHSDAHGCSWCSQKTLATESGCCDRTVRKLLKSFEHRGLIRRVGRLGQHGAQLTDVVVLIGWPERKVIPYEGHPRLGLALKETRETRRLWTLHRAQARAQIPAGPEAAPDQNKDTLNKNTTAQLEKALTACFDALGPWATAENMQGLSDDLETLKGWIDKGIDLHLHILPVLAEKAKSKAKIPLLRTWRYFEIPIGKAVNRKRPKTKNLQVKAKQVQTKPAALEEGAGKPNTQRAPMSSRAVPVPASQHQMPHPAKGEEQAQFAKALTALIAGRKQRSGKVEA